MSVSSQTSDRPASASERAPKCLQVRHRKPARPGWFLNSGLSSFHSPPIESLPADAPTWRHAGVTGPAGRDRPQRTRFGGCGEEATGCAILRRRSEEHTSELQSPYDLVCRLLLEKKKIT